MRVKRINLHVLSYCKLLHKVLKLYIDMKLCPKGEDISCIPFSRFGDYYSERKNSFALVARKCKAPQVVGEILAGLLIGPCLLNLVQTSDAISIFAEIGVVLLMFCTGLGTNLKELMRAGPIATLIACVGVFVPLVGGTLRTARSMALLQWAARNFTAHCSIGDDYDGHQRLHHGGHPAGAGPSEELPWHNHRQRGGH